ncbi:hypothetical protein ABPG75_001165 [Micractinium tetrahymenae]
MSVAGLSKLEQERARRIAENQARLQQIGLLQTVQTIAGAQQASAAERRAKARATKAAHRAARTAVAGRPRRSERVAGIEVPNYNENARLLSLADGAGEGGSRDRRLMRENVSEEIYGVEHLHALGSYQQEWELFVDGYNSNGERIYDKVNGQTCHQCRQKTLGKRTSCSGCGSLQGVLCGDCLFMRYGENVDEVNANPDWLCPLCRDICNCSFHRSKRGWAPTGTLYRHAIAEGYKSVAHYLVLNNLSDDAKLVAMERGMCPPELAAELKKEVAAAASKEAPKGKEAAAAPAEEAAGPERGAPAAELPPAAVEEQLLQAEPAEEPEAESARRSGRGGRGASADAQQQAAQQAAAPAPAAPAVPAAMPRKRKQATVQVVQVSKKQKGGVLAKDSAAGKGAAAPPVRRGLRTSARVAQRAT